jgi:peptide/nickel transport system permease protein
MILPWSVMTLSLLITYLKYLRSGLVEVLPTDFVRTARAKGASERRVVLRHAMRNAVIPLLTMLGIELPNIICNAALVEVVFNIPGIGSLALNAVQQHDYTMFMAGVITVAAIAVVGNWVVDVAYTFVDPRIRSAQSGA